MAACHRTVTDICHDVFSFEIRLEKMGLHRYTSWRMLRNGLRHGSGLKRLLLHDYHTDNRCSVNDDFGMEFRCSHERQFIALFAEDRAKVSDT